MVRRNFLRIGMVLPLPWVTNAWGAGGCPRVTKAAN